MKKSTIKYRKQFEKRKANKSYWNWRDIQQYVFQINRCAYCRRSLSDDRQVDHVNPISHATSKSVNYRSNWVISCPTCNKIKSDTAGVEYPQWVARRKEKFKKMKHTELLKLARRMKNGRN